MISSGLGPRRCQEVTWERSVHLDVPVCVVGGPIDRPDKLTLSLLVIQSNPPPDPAVLDLPLLLHLPEVGLQEGHLLLVEDLQQPPAFPEVLTDGLSCGLVNVGVPHVGEDTAETNRGGVHPALQAVALFQEDVTGLTGPEDEVPVLVTARAGSVLLAGETEDEGGQAGQEDEAGCGEHDEVRRECHYTTVLSVLSSQSSYLIFSLRETS